MGLSAARARALVDDMGLLPRSPSHPWGAAGFALRTGVASGTWVRVYRRVMEHLLTTDACTMPTSERPLRLAEFDALFVENLSKLEREGDTARLHLEGDSSLRERVADLTARESSCCSFFTFTIDGSDSNLTLGIAVPPAHREILDALAARAAELSA